MEVKSKKFEDLLEDLGGTTKYQMLACFFAIYLMFATVSLSQNAIFLSAVPEHRCAVPPVDEPSFNLTESEILNYTIPFDEKLQKYESCYRYDVNLTSCQHVSCIEPTTDVIPCDQGYSYSTEFYDKTAITQWNLVCDRRILDTMASSLFFVGFFIGSWIYGPLSDWYGRKIPLLFFAVMFIISGVGLSFAPIFEVYVFLRVASAIATIVCYVAAFTYANEISAKKHTTIISFFCLQFAGAAHVLLPGFAYALRDWHHLQILCAILPLPFLIFYFYLPESPRWLLTRGREDEAKTVVMKYAQSNGNILLDEDWELVVRTERDKRSADKSKKKYSLLELFKRRYMRIVTCVIMFNWFAIGLVFYGTALNIGNLSGDPYTNSAINASMELLGNMLILLVPWTGKRNLLSGTLLLCGLACLASTICNEFAFGRQAVETLGVVLAIAGKLGATGAYTTIYTITTDVFPTVIRGTGMSIGSMAACVGSVFTPFTIAAQYQFSWLTQTIFGTLAVLAFAVTLLLPETNKMAWLTTLEEAEDFYFKNMTIINKITNTQVEDGRKRLKKSSYENKAMEISNV